MHVQELSYQAHRHTRPFYLMKWLKFTLFLILAVCFAYLGVNLPSNFRSIDERVLSTAGKGKLTIQELAQARMEQDQVGPLLHYCMIKNTNCPATIGLDSDASEIIVQSGRPIEGLDKEELDGMMACVSGVADDLDNELAEKFGCEMIGEDPS